MAIQWTPGKTRNFINYFTISALGLTLCFLAPPLSAQQDQQDPQAQGAPDQEIPQAPPDQSVQQPPQNQGMEQPPPGPGMQQPPQDQGMEPPPRNQGMQQPPPQQAVPQSLTLPAGTVIRVRTNEWLSSDRNVTADEFGAVLDQPIVVDGWVVARRGQSETGRVSLVKKARGSGTSKLGLDLNTLTFVDGQQIPIQTQLIQNTAGSSEGHNAAVVGSTAGIGAVIGAIAGGGTGAAVGAIAGGAAGIIGVNSAPGRPATVPPESVLSFRLQTSVTISTDKSQLAFHPVSQTDYDSRAPVNRAPRLNGPAGPGYPAPPPYYFGNPYAYAYPYPYGYYPAPFGLGFGFYGGYGFGPRFGGFRGFRR